MGKDRYLIATSIYSTDDVRAEVRLVNKTESIWEIDQEGHICQIVESGKEQDVYRLYLVSAVVDRRGQGTPQQRTSMNAGDRSRWQRTRKFVEVRNRDILDQLTTQRYATVNHRTIPVRFAHGDARDLAAIFLFASDNTEVEWRLSRYNTGDGDRFAIGTRHHSHAAISTEAMGFDQQDEIAFIHSHPNEKSGRTEEEFSSMGWRPPCEKYNTIFRRQHPETPTPPDGDSRVVANNEFPSSQRLYVYFRHSGNLYWVRGYPPPQLLFNMRNRNNNSTLFLSEVLNRRL